ncbi:MAG: hypothetical protein VX185_04945 [Pseudomonadota bacterium]|nr:hypothetical protein [Pseudomonadota bacterium]
MSMYNPAFDPSYHPSSGPQITFDTGGATSWGEQQSYNYLNNVQQSSSTPTPIASSYRKEIKEPLTTEQKIAKIKTGIKDTIKGLLCIGAASVALVVLVGGGAIILEPIEKAYNKKRRARDQFESNFNYDYKLTKQMYAGFSNMNSQEKAEFNKRFSKMGLKPEKLTFTIIDEKPFYDLKKYPQMMRSIFNQMNQMQSKYGTSIQYTVDIEKKDKDLFNQLSPRDISKLKAKLAQNGIPLDQIKFNVLPKADLDLTWDQYYGRNLSPHQRNDVENAFKEVGVKLFGDFGLPNGANYFEADDFDDPSQVIYPQVGSQSFAQPENYDLDSANPAERVLAQAYQSDVEKMQSQMSQINQRIKANTSQEFTLDIMERHEEQLSKLEAPEMKSLINSLSAKGIDMNMAKMNVVENYADLNLTPDEFVARNLTFDDRALIAEEFAKHNINLDMIAYSIV